MEKHRYQRVVMRSFVSFALLLFLFSSCDKQENELPNIIYILADDLGYGELGCYGQEIIETPNIDKLASEGMKFTQHYSGAPVCAPARCVLLTGQHSGHAYIRGNDEWKERGEVWSYEAMFKDPNLEGQRPLPDSIALLSELIKQAGYTTGMVGKWGLGAPLTNSVPNKRGFDYFMGYNCQRQAHTLYPMHLWENEKKVILQNKMIPPHSNLAEDADPNDPKSYDDYNLNDYAPALMHDAAMKFVEAQDGPFFLYYASPLPHVPLQAPKKWEDYYRKKLGAEEAYTGKGYFPALTPRATYAAMISYLDEQVGDLVRLLKEKGIYNNTIIMFSSDNGPSYAGGADTPFFDSAKPFKTTYGWAKGFLHEGGIRVPFISSWPNKIKAGSSSDHICAFQDVMPTLLELIGSEIYAPDGISFAPTLLQQTQKAHKYLFWDYPEYGYQQAVRMGDWKGIKKELRKTEAEIELYHLPTDIQELNNVAHKHPDIVQEIAAIMKAERTTPQIEKFKIPLLDN